MELLDVYNSNGELSGKIIQRGTKDEELGEDEHIAVAIIYIQNNEGKFLIQKTSASKGEIYSSTGGHVTHGETPRECIIRETKEEIGLDISNDNIIDLGHICVDFPVRFIFYLKKDIDIGELLLDKEEVESLHFFDLKELKHIIEKGKMHKGHISVLKKVLEYTQQ